jgi:hypothetical protein
MVCFDSSHTIYSAAPPPASLPYVTCWPKDASDAFYQTVCERYFATDVPVNRFQYCILIHKADSAADAVQCLSQEGAFATYVARCTLLGIICEARNTQWCKSEVLDTLERYCTYAFVLDGTAMTCGAMPM